LTRIDLGAKRNLARILDDAFALYRSYARTLLTIAVAVVVPVDLVVFGIGLGQLTSGYDRTPPNGVGLLQIFVSLLITTPLITAMVLRVVLDVAAGQPVSTTRAISSGLELFTPLLVGIGLAVAGIALGFVALVIPGVYVAVLWAFVAQAVVVDGRRGPQALARSAELVRGHWWWVLGVVLVTNLVAGLLGLLISVPARELAKSADSEAIVLVGTMLVQVFTLSLLALTNTLLYFTLRGGQDASVAVVEPHGFEPPRPGEG
jgi:hypothetical protein